MTTPSAKRTARLHHRQRSCGILTLVIVVAGLVLLAAWFYAH